jgi:hypothetical protein
MIKRDPAMNKYNDRRHDKLKGNQKFVVTKPCGSKINVYTNEGLEAMLESGSIPEDSLIQLSSSTNNSSVFK